MKWHADSGVLPGRDGLNVYNLRAWITPVPESPLSFELEWVRELNGDALRSTGWTALAAWQFGGRFKPRLSYRYAFFQGDDPATPRQEAFDSLFVGFYDWGSWFQGEIAGGYILTNSNLISHRVRLDVSPGATVDAGLLFWDFLFDEPGSLGPAVTSAHALTELDGYVDWKINTHFGLIAVAAVAEPGKGGEQAYGRTSTFTYGLVFFSSPPVSGCQGGFGFPPCQAWPTSGRCVCPSPRDSVARMAWRSRTHHVHKGGGRSPYDPRGTLTVMCIPSPLSTIQGGRRRDATVWTYFVTLL